MSQISFSDPRRQVIERLAEEVRRRQGAVTPEAGLIATGCPAFDRLLPRGGFRRGTLVEWIAATPGAGATTLGLLAARQASVAGGQVCAPGGQVCAPSGQVCAPGGKVCAPGGKVIVVDPEGVFYPPAAIACGLQPEDVLVVHPSGPRETSWALDQVLRCPGVAAVLTWPERLAVATLRRWQLAVEQSGVLGLLVRSAAARQEPSWADVRLWIEPRPSGGARRRLRIEVLHARGAGLQCGAAGSEAPGIEVTFDHETHALEFVRGAPRGVPVVPQLADPMPVRRAIGA